LIRSEKFGGKTQGGGVKVESRGGNPKQFCLEAQRGNKEREEDPKDFPPWGRSRNRTAIISKRKKLKWEVGECGLRARPQWGPRILEKITQETDVFRTSETNEKGRSSYTRTS